MGNSNSLAPAWVANRSAMFDRKAERQLNRFHRRYRIQVQAMAKRHPALMDLAFSFPALLFVLSVPHQGVDGEALRHLALAGAPLKALAKQANLPMWTRKLLPESFGQPLNHLPRQDIYSRQIAQFVPRKARFAERWLGNVVFASEYGDEAFAVWVAREYQTEKLSSMAVRHHALWAWFSRRPDLDGCALAAQRWRPQISKAAARKAMGEWLQRVRLHVTIADAAMEPLWLEATHVDGFDFVPLASAHAIHEEARIMENCIRSYGWDIAANSARLWSMRRDGTRVATLSVGLDQDLNLLRITEIKGPKNEKIPRPVALAAKRWMDSVDVTQIEVAPKNWEDVLPSAKAWAVFFKPYWMEKRRIPWWLPLAPRPDLLGSL